MSTRRRVASVLAFVLVGSGGVVAAQALAPDGVKQPSPVERVQRYYPSGPSAVYGSDFGGIGGIDPLRFGLPGGGRQAGVVEASFGYRTHGQGPFYATLDVRDAADHRVGVRPGRVVLARAPGGTSTTVRFLARGLDGGERYRADFGVNSVAPPSGTNRVTTRTVVLTVELG